jgi:anti-sigma factor ChrR (cupin superfamily)
MECAESVALLSEYREGTLNETLLIEVRAHLTVCPPCLDVYVDLETIVIAASSLRAEQDIPFPDETVIWQRMGIAKRTLH